MAPHSSTFTWKLPWMEEPCGLQSMGLRRVRHDWATSLSLFTFHFHALEREMATHSSVLAWRIPGTEELGRLPSMGSHRVRDDWSDLAEREIKTNGYRYNLVDPKLGKAEGWTGLNLQTEKRNLSHSGWGTKDSGLWCPLQSLEWKVHLSRHWGMLYHQIKWVDNWIYELRERLGIKIDVLSQWYLKTGLPEIISE